MHKCENVGIYTVTIIIVKSFKSFQLMLLLHTPLVVGIVCRDVSLCRDSGRRRNVARNDNVFSRLSFHIFFFLITENSLRNSGFQKFWSGHRSRLV